MIIGTTINSRYDIKMLIGDGGMANVYLAYDRTLKRHVAIKMLRYELSRMNDLSSDLNENQHKSLI